MIQLLIFGLAILCALAALATLARGTISITRGSKVQGTAARLIGAGMLVLAVVMAGFAWIILPQIR